MNDPTRALRHLVYWLFIALAVGNATGRILSVNSVDNVRLESYRIDERMREFRKSLEGQGLDDQELAERMDRKRDDVTEKLRLQRPFLSANDRSRWMAARALVEHGTYAIDEILKEPTWDSIDIVRHRDAQGEFHFYSSKPPLTYLHMAAAYWLLNSTTGLSLADEPYAAGRVLLLVLNVLPLVLMLAMAAYVFEQLGRGDFDRLLAMATICFGTMLTPFATVINNHLWGATCAAVAVAAYVGLRNAEKPRGWVFVVVGAAAALTAVCELPALSLVAALGLLVFAHAPRGALLLSAPAALLVIAAYLGTTYHAHGSWKPPYMHRNGEANSPDNWYLYTYVDDRGAERQSYWMNRQGIDAGEESKAVYALHTLVGHHGIFSLTPIWLLMPVGGLMWLAGGSRLQRELAVVTLVLTVVCLTFYINRPLEDRNYGGMTQGFRWAFWFAPLWAALAMPAAAWLSRSRAGQAFALALLAWSAMSASYATWNPWTQPWIWNWLEYTGVK